MARVKPKTDGVVFKSIEDVDRALGDIAEHKRSIAAIEAKMNAAIDAAKLQAMEDSAFARAEIAAIEAALVNYVKKNKAELFSDKKSMDLTYGTIGFRLSTKLLLQGKEGSWERVIEALREQELHNLIRVKEEPDKEALKGLKSERLKELGCKVVQVNTFFYEVSEAELSTESAA
jgi:phage host-nuclease inhibitor protein Gam